MKRNLYALNEKDENKCTSQESCRCWTLVNNQCPYGGKMQSPRRLPLWWSPPGHPQSGSSGWLTLEFFFSIYFYIYLVALGLSCSTQDLQSSLRHAESLVSRSGIEPRLLAALGAQNLSHWTTREVPKLAFFRT